MIRKISILLITMMAATGCITTTETEELKKWEPRERAEAHVRLGMTYLRQKQYETARSEFDLATTIFPQIDSAYHAKGLMYSQIGEYALADENFAKAVSLNRKNYIAVNDYGIYLCQQKQTQKGITQLMTIEDDTANDQALGTLLGLGICHSFANNYVQGNNYLRRVLEQAPSLPQALLPLAEMQYEQKEYLSSRAFLERYFSTGTLSERSLYLAAKVEKKMGADSKAKLYRNELRQRFPQSELNKKLDQIIN